MATTPDLQEPQIAAARTAAWHQSGDPLLTLEAARSWLHEYGLVLFSPRGASLAAPAPSLVEATLGVSRATATPAESATARTLVARLVGEGAALPLNLLGGPGDVPDFLVSTSAFPFVFTLRGDKGWKRPPETAGAVKVTPLALRVYELLAEKGALTIAEIVPEIGREVTDSAVARALSELWQMLRVLPVLQQGEGETIWELTTTRFLKAVKAGANAGQPTALSALVSLYLAQAMVASEEEIATFLSPLTARSRVRDVLHGLIAGRQLDEGVVEGKAVLYIPDSLPDFAALNEQADDVEDEDEEDEQGAEEQSSDGDDLAAEGDLAGGGAAPKDGSPERIRRFEAPAGAGDRKLRGQPFRREGAGSGSPGERPRRGPGPGAREDRPRRAPGAREGRPGGFGNGGRYEGRGPSAGQARDAGPGGPPRRPAGGADRPSFARPWDEERGARPPRPEGDRGPRGPRKEYGAGGAEGSRPPRFDRPDRSARPFQPRTEGGDRPFRPRPEGGDRPPRPFRPRTEGGDRPFRPRPEGGDRPARPFRPRTEGDERSSRPFRPRPEGGDRPFRPRPEGGGDRPFRPRPEGGDRPARPFRPRPEGGGDRPFRPRPEGGDRPFRPRPEGGDRPFRPRPGGGDRPSRPFSPRSEGDRPFRPRREGEDASPRPRGGDGQRSGFAGRPGAGAPFNRRPEGGRPPSRGFGGGGSASAGRPPRGDRPAGRPGGGSGFGGAKRPGGFRSGPKGPGAGGPGRSGPSSGGSRPPQRPRSEDEA